MSPVPPPRPRPRCLPPLCWSSSSPLQPCPSASALPRGRSRPPMATEDVASLTRSPHPWPRSQALGDEPPASMAGCPAGPCSALLFAALLAPAPQAQKPGWCVWFCRTRHLPALPRRPARGRSPPCSFGRRRGLTQKCAMDAFWCCAPDRHPIEWISDGRREGRRREHGARHEHHHHHPDPNPERLLRQRRRPRAQRSVGRVRSPRGRRAGQRRQAVEVGHIDGFVIATVAGWPVSRPSPRSGRP